MLTCSDTHQNHYKVIQTPKNAKNASLKSTFTRVTLQLHTLEMFPKKIREMIYGIIAVSYVGIIFLFKFFGTAFKHDNGTYPFS